MNGILIIDKPAGWTSHDIVGKLRGLLKEKRVGHGGTLDPMATGVLPVFVGRATRAVSFCENADKAYTAGLKLGLVTDTQDITGKVLSESDAAVTLDELRGVLPRFRGEQDQLPPMYSAIKVGGQKLYELARRGLEAERTPRRITVFSLDAEASAGGFTLRVVCSKGTYIRTLCHDIGTALGCGGVMSSLRRTRAGAFTLEEAVSLDAVEEAAREGRSSSLLKPIDTLFPDCPPTEIDEEQKRKCLNGNDFPVSLVDGLYRVYDAEGGFLMLGSVRSKTMKTVKSFFEV